MILMKMYFSIFSRFNAIFPDARDPNFQADEEDISRDEHGSGLKPISAGSGLDRTAIF